MKIAVAGLGYVGLSNAILLACHHDVTAVDIIPEKIRMVTSGIPPIVDPECKKFRAQKDLSLKATLDPVETYREAQFVIIATPTNYDPETNAFKTESIEAVVEQVRRINPSAVMLIKSTIPVGYTRDLIRKTGCEMVMFSPEFLREGQALHDNLHLARIIVGGISERARLFANILKDAAIKKDIDVLLKNLDEVEAIKLFANT